MRLSETFRYSEVISLDYSTTDHGCTNGQGISHHTSQQESPIPHIETERHRIYVCLVKFLIS
ncbi:hypothetical protein E2C01_054013 [Portunus trituberculatus]|uniref:Uncharacterized protein n=1 Tax=Portunus trituberculatus TaxID=210409 RepID=A0A5B7GI67_PORTR|nr:hypothetical protein [Portunus trituberculatus]